MINIAVTNTTCWASWDNDPEEWINLQEACKYKATNYWFSPKFREGFWDGSICLFKKVRGKPCGWFPTGLLQTVVMNLRVQNVPNIHIDDKRIIPETPTEIDASLLSFTPRDYQIDGPNALLRERRGVIQLPTGAGKTKAMAAVLATLNLPALWITHETALAEQNLKEIRESLANPPKIGFYAGGKRKDIQRWTIGLVQSLYRHRSELLWWFNQIRVIVLDECHRGSGSSWYTLCLEIDAPFRFGCSATPFERADKAVYELMGITGGLVYSVETGDVKQHLSRPHVEMITLPAKYSTAADWKAIYTDLIVHNDLRNSIIINRAMKSIRQSEKCLIFVSRLEHGRLLSDLLTEEIGTNGLHTFISGSTPQHARTEIYDRLRSGHLRVLIAMDKVAGEGQNIPSVNRIIIGGGLKAVINTKQRVGRGMRPKGSSDDGWGGKVQIHDFVDTGHPRLTEHSDLRAASYSELGAVIKEVSWRPDDEGSLLGGEGSLQLHGCQFPVAPNR